MAEPIVLSMPIGDDRVEVNLDSDADALAAPSEPASDGRWSITAPIEWNRIAAVRLLSAEFADQSVLAVLAVRPAGARGHDSEHVVAVLRSRKGDETELERVLLSTEYGSEGEPVRVGIELHPRDEEIPLRGAGNAGASRIAEDNAVKRSVTELAMRLDGTEGKGAFEIWKAL